MADEPATPAGAPATPPVTQGATPPVPEPEPQADGDPADLGEAGRKALKAERDRAAAAEKKAKELETELETFRRSQMTEQEQAIDKARAEGRTEGRAESANEIAAAQFAAAAAGRLDDDQIATLTAGLDVAAFLKDGKVDVEKIKTFVDTIAPAPNGHLPADLGQGARGGGTGAVDPLLASVQAIAGR